MTVSGLHHINIRTTDLAETQKFYEDIIGLHVGPRPPFPGAGIWLYAEGGDHPWVHISMADNANGVASGPDEGFGHIAFSVAQMKPLLDKLESNGIEYDLHASAGREWAQLFFYDPSGVYLEFTCAMADAEGEGLEVLERSR